MKSLRFACFKKHTRFVDLHAWAPFAAAAAFLFVAPVYGETDYYRHVFFDNSLTSDFYFYSSANASAPSTLVQKNSRLPVETKTFLTPPNALRLEWRSNPGGGWEAELHVVNFRNRFPGFEGSHLSFWCFAPQGISAADRKIPPKSHSGKASGKLPGNSATWRP